MVLCYTIRHDLAIPVSSMMLWHFYCAQTSKRLGHNDVAFLHRGIAITHDHTTS